MKCSTLYFLTILGSLASAKEYVKGVRRRVSSIETPNFENALTVLKHKKKCKKSSGKKVSTPIILPTAAPTPAIYVPKVPNEECLDSSDDDGGGSTVGDTGNDTTTPPATIASPSSRCDQIMDGSASTSGQSESFKIDMLLAIDGNETDVLRSLEAFLRARLALQLANACTNGRRRYLQSTAAAIENLSVSTTKDGTASARCESTNEIALATGQECLGVDVLLEVFYSGDDTSGLLAQLRDALIALCDEIHDLPGIVDTFDPCPFILLSENAGASDGGGTTDEQDNTGGDDGPGDEGTGGPTSDADNEDRGIAGIAEQNQEHQENDISTPAIIAVAGAGLALLLLLICAANRNHQDPLQHKALEDDLPPDDDTYLKDIDNASDDSRAWDIRLTHVVGEENSVVTNWTDYTSQLDSIRNKRRSSRSAHDVHKCASATCQVCENRRRSGVKPGVQFIPAFKPSMSVSEPGAREYGHEDTVDM